MSQSTCTQISWVITKRCFIACRHCIAEASPAEGSMDLEVIPRVIEHLPEDGIYSLELTGGDPFADFPLLTEVLRQLGGKKLGRRVTVHTTGQWAVDDETARSRLNLLRDLGADGVDFLCEDDFHFEAGLQRTNYERAVTMAREVFGEKGAFIRKPDLSEGIVPLGRGAAREMEGYWGKDRCYVRGTCVDERMQLHIVLSGAVYVCPNSVAPSVGSMLESSYEEIVDALRHDPWHSALMESGPLGVAALAGLDLKPWESRVDEIGECRTCIELTKELITTRGSNAAA